MEQALRAACRQAAAPPVKQNCRSLFLKKMQDLLLELLDLLLQLQFLLHYLLHLKRNKMVMI